MSQTMPRQKVTNNVTFCFGSFGCMKFTACRHPMHDEQTNFQTLLKSHFFRQVSDIS